MSVVFGVWHFLPFVCCCRRASDVHSYLMFDWLEDCSTDLFQSRLNSFALDIEKTIDRCRGDVFWMILDGGFVFAPVIPHSASTGSAGNPGLLVRSVRAPHNTRACTLLHVNMYPIMFARVCVRGYCVCAWE